MQLRSFTAELWVCSDPLRPSISACRLYVVFSKTPPPIRVEDTKYLLRLPSTNRKYFEIRARLDSCKPVFDEPYGIFPASESCLKGKHVFRLGALDGGEVIIRDPAASTNALPISKEAEQLIARRQSKAHCLPLAGLGCC
ncbi:hypothetical protein O181_014669 [Austropuccinia psidii MF-1]|uniref:Uncharacterized protein n=1 Tax=Austropuccinia psidii MF-1 TaxID=1389203 RepID=A0A9Q3GQ31_9BASI|nr:hypothetical protein [Austropuccinia psidii MF-1]